MAQAAKCSEDHRRERPAYTLTTRSMWVVTAAICRRGGVTDYYDKFRCVGELSSHVQVQANKYFKHNQLVD